MWFIKLRHFLDNNGEIAVSHGPARKLAEFVCSIVVAVTSYTQEISVATGIRCRRRPKRKPCYYTPEELEVLLGYICARANHTSDKDLEDALDALYESLEDLLDSTKLRTSH